MHASLRVVDKQVSKLDLLAGVEEPYIQTDTLKRRSCGIVNAIVDRAGYRVDHRDKDATLASGLRQHHVYPSITIYVVHSISGNSELVVRSGTRASNFAVVSVGSWYLDAPHRLNRTISP